MYLGVFYVKKRKKLAIISIILVIIFLPFTCYKEVKANPAILVLEGMKGVSSLLGILGLSVVLDLNSNNSYGIADEIGTCETCGEIFYYSGNGSAVQNEFIDYKKHIKDCNNNNNNGNKKIPATEAIYGKYLWDVMTDKQKEDYEESVKNGSEFGLRLSLGQLDEFRDKVNSSQNMTLNTTIVTQNIDETYVLLKEFNDSNPSSSSNIVFPLLSQLKNDCTPYVLYSYVNDSSLEHPTRFLVVCFGIPGSTLILDNEKNVIFSKDGVKGYNLQSNYLDWNKVQNKYNYNSNGHLFGIGGSSYNYNDFFSKNSTLNLNNSYNPTILEIFDGDILTDNQVSDKKLEIVNPDIELKPGTGPITFTVPGEKVLEFSEPMYNPDTNTFHEPVENIEDLQETVTKIENTSSNDINDTDVPERANLDFSPLYADLSKKFPFCIPFDLFNLIDSFSAESERPSFTITFPSIAGSDPVSFEFNFDDYYVVIQIFRYFVLSSFVVGLIVNTKKILGGS